MFHPVDRAMDRGWVGRIENDHVVHLAAQTLQAFFTGGGSAREHAVYPLAAVRLLAPVLHPPSVRLFEDGATFAFANPAAILGPHAVVRRPPGDDRSQGLVLLPRVAAVIGAGGALGGLTILAEWRAPDLAPPKDRDFALGLGPLLVTPDDFAAGPGEAIVLVDGEERGRLPVPAYDWDAARDLAAAGTTLYAGDVLAGPALDRVEGLADPGRVVEIEIEPVGTLVQTVGPAR